LAGVVFVVDLVGREGLLGVAGVVEDCFARLLLVLGLFGQVDLKVVDCVWIDC
jgi:hypothetical protein